MADNYTGKDQPDVLKEFHGRFIALAAEAKANGVLSVCVLQYVDLLDDSTDECFTSNGGPHLAIGLMEWTKGLMLADLLRESGR